MATRLSADELAEVEAAAKRSGKSLADWLRTAALEAARPVPDVNELLLAEITATRYALLSLFHASAKAEEKNERVSPEAVLKIREAADARKLPTAKKMLQEFRAAEIESQIKTGGSR